MAFHFLILCRQIYDFESAKRVGELFVYPLMIKSRRLAYDGRGNVVAKSEEEISFAVNVFGGYDRALYVEKWAPFVKVYVASNLQLIGLKIYLYAGLHLRKTRAGIWEHTKRSYQHQLLLGPLCIA
ncbi:phosphoribosylaminoimidazole carboxylase-like isoform X2 [Camellia sinensis]|uniref:phosphoribosylaminoimidazole carboxylase-like isoform X2 n=1 Tax=Camellia sinensis TaxID=4442 RepID=UPI001035A48C|nr:phosphoribosylaminoimidazole carboxylase-like isoform X2 [Camellia sinensis]